MNPLKQTKSKPITTSVPSFAIRFHASGEELEELYPSEEEEKSERSATDKSEKNSESLAGTTETNKHESSPMRDYLNKFGKRSSSIDTGINESTLNKETSDPWRIFSEFKGKLTKTVEEKLSEIKSKNSEGENSPKLSQKDKNKTSNSKENSSISDSEEQSFSECSIAKSSGLSSTAEDLEMSSDDENSLAESEKTPTENITKDFAEPAKKHILRHRKTSKPTNKIVQFTKDESDSHVKISSLSTVHEKESVDDDVESGVEACEELGEPRVRISLDVDAQTLIAPPGFVDLRCLEVANDRSYLKSSILWPILICIVSVYFFLPLPPFLCGFVFGCVLTAACCFAYFKFKLGYLDLEFDSKIRIRRRTLTRTDLPILEVPAVKEYQPMTKFEGWMNEYPDHYDPRTYHIMNTQSVFLKLEGSVLRISHTRAKIPKRAMWDEPKHHVTFTHHRMYNLKGSQIMLLPTGLIHKRLWSKKYPICIILNKEKMNLDLNVEINSEEIDNDDEQKLVKPSNLKNNENNTDTTNETVEDTSQAEDQIQNQEEEFFSDAVEEERDEISITADWDTLTIEETHIVETKIYLFPRTCRDKEDWFRRLIKATHDVFSETEPVEDETSTPISQPVSDPNEPGVSLGSNEVQPAQDTIEPQTNAAETNVKKKINDREEEEDYACFMAKFNQARKKKSQTEDETEENEKEKEVPQDDFLWVNSLIARIIYDVRKHDRVIERFQSLIQKKMGTIKLPYFIDSILLHDLTLGATTPSVSNIQGPMLDDRGLWLHLDVVYEGVISMAIVTKLNLMKLKEQAGKLEEPLGGAPAGEEQEGRSPMFHSDVEDSAESSDDEAVWVVQTMPGVDGSQNSTPRKPNTGGKKFLKMVDKIASSKYFQQATENKYIKRAMEGVSKTEIKLTVEVQHLSGTLAVNIPPPPSDRMWIGFQGNPELQLSALPTFGERSLNFMHVSRWIEKKLAVEFQKFLVLPNMEDFVLPMLIPQLPH